MQFASARVSTLSFCSILSRTVYISSKRVICKGPKVIARAVLLAAASVFGFEADTLLAQTPVSFKEQIAPILQEHCVACHGAKRAEGGYRLDAVEQMLKPGDGGNNPVVPMKSAESEIVLRIGSHDPDVQMPADSEPLASQQIELIMKWMDEGAKLDVVSMSDPLWLVIPPAATAKSPEHYPNALPITALSFSLDGSQLISSGYHEALVWNPVEGNLLGRLPNQVQRTYTMLGMNAGNVLAVGGGTPGAKGELRLVDRNSGATQHVLARSNDVVRDCAIRPGKNELAVALADNTIRIIDLDKMEQRKTIVSHADWVTQLAYSDDGKRLGSSSRDKSAKVIDAETGDLLVSYPGHAAAVRGIASIGDGSQWMSVGADNKWHRWELEGAKKLAEITLSGEPAKLLKIDQSVIVPCSDKHWVKIDLSSNAVSLKIPGHEDWVVSVAYSPTTNKLATGGIDGSVRVWNAADGTLVKSWMAKP